MTGLLELAAACESATGPDRELDLAIGLAALGWQWLEDEFGYDLILDIGAANYIQWNAAGQIPDCVPSPTTSIDVAASILNGLCPDAHWPPYYRLCSADPDHKSLPSAIVCLPRWMDVPKYLGEAYRCATAPLALCAAALRARATPSESSPT